MRTRLLTGLAGLALTLATSALAPKIAAAQETSTVRKRDAASAILIGAPMNQALVDPLPRFESR